MEVTIALTTDGQLEASVDNLRSNSQSFREMLDDFSRTSYRDFEVSWRDGTPGRFPAQSGPVRSDGGDIWLIEINRNAKAVASGNRVMTLEELIAHEMGHAIIPSPPGAVFGSPKTEAQIIQRVNDVRADLGLPPIRKGDSISYREIKHYNTLNNPDGWNGHLTIGPPQCFLAGTLIDMWPLSSLDGSDPALQPDTNGFYDEAAILAAVWKKPIEEITPEDIVVSPDKDGRLKPGRVTQTFQNRSKHILDVPVPNFNEQGEFDGSFESLMMTPGHVTYCAKVDGEVNKFADSHVPVIDILRTDGALMKADGIKYRASTGCKVGSFEDQLILAIAGKMDDQGGLMISDEGMIRLGTKFIGHDGQEFSVADMAKKHGMEVKPNGKLGKKGSSDGGPFLWSFTPKLPKPEDYVLQRSNLALDDIYAADDWEGMAPQVPAPMPMRQTPSNANGDVLQASPNREAISPNIPTSMRNSPDQPKMSRKQRRAHEAKMRKQARTMRRGATVH